MTVYGFLIIWCGICALVCCITSYSMERIEVIGGSNERRYVPVAAMIMAFPLFWATGFRENVGDTGVYRNGFLDLPSSLFSIPSYLQTINKDKGFAVIQILIKTVIGNDDRLFLVILAAVQVGILAYVYRKYSPNYLLSLFLFIASTDYISWLFNGIRQFLAATIIFAAIKLISEKKYIWVILIILLATTIHASAIIMLPVIFIVQGKIWNKKVILAIGLLALTIPFMGRLTPILESALENTQYDNIMTDQLWLNDNGTSLFRTAVYSIPAILSLFCKKYIDDENNSILNLSVNMSIIAAGVYLVSSFSSGVYIGRLPIYMSLYSYISLPWIISCSFTKGSRTIIYSVMIVAYLVFYYYQMTMAWSFKLF